MKMANLYKQELKFIGDESEITRLIEFVRNGEIPFDFTKILSVPKDSKEGEWLTKLSMYLDPLCEYDRSSKTYTVWFSTVTTVPDMLDVFAEKFPSLDFIYRYYDYNEDDPDGGSAWFEY